MYFKLQTVKIYGAIKTLLIIITTNTETVCFQLAVTSESNVSELCIPIEVEVGTTDSRSQRNKADDAASTIETECSLYSHSLYSHSGIL